MSTSNRWLFASLLAVLLVMAGTTLLLFRQFDQGHIVSIRQEQQAGRSHFKLPPIHRLTLEGTVWVNLIPADSDAIEIPNEQVGADLRAHGLFGPGTSYISQQRQLFRVAGDTLFVQGDISQPLHRPFADWYYRIGIQQIDVYVSSLEYIRITNGQVLLKGRPHLKPGTSITLEAAGATVWLGEMDTQPEGGIRHKILPDECFDTVSLRLDNTVVLLNRPAMIADLHARLDNASEINDRSATLGRCHISASPGSRVSFAGANLSKTILTTE